MTFYHKGHKDGTKVTKNRIRQFHFDKALRFHKFSGIKFSEKPDFSEKSGFSENVMPEDLCLTDVTPDRHTGESRYPEPYDTAGFRLLPE